MTAKARDEGGVTLVEVLVSMSLFMIVMAGVLQLEAMALKAQMRSIAWTTLTTNALMARQALSQAVTPASAIRSPALGASSADLSVLSNADPETGAALVSSLPAEYQRFCVDPPGKRLYLYTGPGAPYAGECGTGAPAGSTRFLIAGGEPFLITASFFRPAAEANVILMDYTVSLQNPILAAGGTVSQQLQATISNAIF
ncbi:MAG: prepilin-type N-terminal cleavage/methylation domain-containing protein [Elusimicrobiota bacterium]|jgi:hypothetical protein